jgi:two-component system CheB/CheR fusion protein
VAELSSAEDDMRNLLNSTEIATIFVDNDMRVRRFTLEATTIVNLIQTDIGRPLKHVVTNLSYNAMMTDLAEVLKKLIPKETEVQTKEGQWYMMRILPCRTADNRIDGAVLTFSSIVEQKKNQDLLEASNLKMEQAWELLRTIFDMNSDPMVVLDENGKLIIANTVFSDVLNIPQTDIEKMDISKLNRFIPKQISLKPMLKTALTEGDEFKTKDFVLNSSNNTQKYSIHGRIILKNQNFPYRILLKFVLVR